MRLLTKVFVTVFSVSLVLVAFALVVLPQTGRRVLSVQSGSMEPVLVRGDAVVVTDVSDESIRVGDIITFSANIGEGTTSVTHRVIETPSTENSGRFITQGDANPLPDDPIRAESILGRVETHVPFAGTAMDFSTSKLGLALLIYVPALSIVIGEIAKLTKHFEKSQSMRRIEDGRLDIYQPNKRRMVQPLLVIGMVGLLGVSSHTALAQMRKGIVLSNNTISAIADDPGGGDDCDDGVEVDVDIDDDGSGSSDTDIDIDVDIDQDASSGDATNGGNTNGDGATSGDATNCSDTDIDITITN